MTTEQPGASPALSDQLGPLPKRLRECAEEVMEFPHPSACDHLHTAHALMRHAADVVERLRQALRDIADPIAAWQRDLQPGYTLDGGMCVHMANDPETYKRMAREALKA